MKRASRLLAKGIGLALVLSVLAAPASAFDLPPLETPELDPGSMAGAVTLLTGGLLMISDRLRRR